MNIVVTGASQGLGRELCMQLIRGGNRVWAVARNEGALSALQVAAGPSLRFSIVDVCSDDSVKRWTHDMQSAGFRPDAVVLNASILLEDMESGFDVQRAKSVIDTNVTGTLRCVSAFLPDFLRSGKGTFVLIASTSALRPSDRSASYAASKAAVAMALRSLRLRFQGSGIRFKTVYLGPMATAMWEGRHGILVASPKRAARRIVAFVHGQGDILFYPWLSTALLRMSRLVPDRVFSFVARQILK